MMAQDMQFAAVFGTSEILNQLCQIIKVVLLLSSYVEPCVQKLNRKHFGNKSQSPMLRRLCLQTPLPQKDLTRETLCAIITAEAVMARNKA